MIYKYNFQRVTSHYFVYNYLARCILRRFINQVHNLHSDTQLIYQLFSQISDPIGLSYRNSRRKSRRKYNMKMVTTDDEGNVELQGFKKLSDVEEKVTKTISKRFLRLKLCISSRNVMPQIISFVVVKLRAIKTHTTCSLNMRSTL